MTDFDVAGGLSKVITDALEPELREFEEAQRQVATLRQQLTSLENQVAREDVINLLGGKPNGATRAQHFSTFEQAVEYLVGASTSVEAL